MKVAVIVVIPLLSVIGVAQMKLQGKMQINGGTEINFPYTRFVQIMALNPPAATGTDYNTFYSNVMTNPNVDGVTVEIDWSLVETGFSLTAACPINTDTCQLDSVGIYHQYDWSAYDNTGGASYPNGIAQWFNPFTDPVTGKATYKKVNIVLSGINAGGSGTNTVTPWYVASPNSGYINYFTPARQDVLNTTKDCSNIPWKGVQSAAFSYYDASHVGVVLTNCCTQTSTTLHDGDTIWINNASPPSYNPGSPVTIHVLGNSQFEYSATVAFGSTCTGCTYISVAQSSPVPYEAPYVAAWEAFMAAAIKHFSPGYKPIGFLTPVGLAGTNQLGYIRSGTWVGGESYAYCITNGTSGGLVGLAAPYSYTCAYPVGGNCSNTNMQTQTNANNTWLKDYNLKVQYIESLGPTMARYWPIDQIANDNSYANAMAEDAALAGNGLGAINGFGSQALSLLDKLAGCSGAIANWCNLFTTTYSMLNVQNMPLELQEISISDPTNQSCPGNTCGFPPNGVSGDMRLWLPFAVSKNATVFEIYYADLGLAFDPNYCTSITACYYPQFVTTANEWIYYSAGNGGSLTTGVGQGSNCNPPVVTMASGAGDCSYAAALISAHGYH